MEVSTRTATGQGVRWVSDGSGEYEVSTVDNLDFQRGTRIVLKLKAEARDYSRESEVEKVLKRHSLFINYPIKLNG